MAENEYAQANPYADAERRASQKKPAAPAPPTPDNSFLDDTTVPERAKRSNAFGGEKGREATRLLQGINQDVTGKRTIDIPDDFGRNTKYPEGKDELDSWWSYLSAANKAKAKAFDDYLGEKGYKGWFDPNIKGGLLEMRNRLFDETSGQWDRAVNRNKRNRKSPAEKEGPSVDPDNPEKLFGPGKDKRGELKGDAPVIGMLGGNYMDEG